ncbi:MAG: DUF4349 domain-containing protein [Bacteroidota bacterium]
MKHLIAPILICITLLSCQQRAAEDRIIDGINSPNGFYDLDNNPSGDVDFNSILYESNDQTGNVQLNFAAQDASFTPPLTNQPSPIENTERKIIKVGWVGFQVEHLEKSLNNIDQSLTKYGAYIASSDQQEDAYQKFANVSIRVKAEMMDSLMDELVKEAIFIKRKSINTNDVSEEFIDLNTRLKTKMEAENQYLQILKKAKTVEEILKVQDQLRKIREEIEAKQGRLVYLENQVSLSTITLYIYENKDVIAEAPDKGFGTKLIAGFSNGWNSFLRFILGLVTAWPLTLIAIVLLAWARRIWKKGSLKKA